MLTKFAIVIILSSYGTAHTHSFEAFFKDQTACDERAAEIAEEIKRNLTVYKVVFCERAER